MRYRTKSFLCRLMMLAPPALLGCGQTDAVGPEAVEATESAVQSPAPIFPPDTTLEQKYLPGLGYFDGITCDVWPKDITFNSIASFLNRVSTTAPSTFLQGTKALNGRLTTMGITNATVFGAKRELVVLYGKLSNGEQTLAVVDPSPKQGFLIDNGWLCTESDLHNNPNNCTTQDLVVGSGPFVTYKVLGHTTKAVGMPPHTAMVVAPQVRFVAPAGTSIVTNVNLIAVGQRVYGGAPYATGEDLSKRTTGLVTLKALPTISTPSATPTTSEWRAAMSVARRPSLLALIGDEIGGFAQVTAFSPAPIESLVVAPSATPASYDVTTGKLTVTPTELFGAAYVVFQPTSPTNPYCDLQLFASDGTSLGQSCDFHLTLAASPTVRGAGASGAAFVISGKTPNTATVTATTGAALRATYATGDLRTFIMGVVKPKLDIGTTHYLWTSLIPGGVVAGTNWRNTASAYQSNSLNTLAASLATLINNATPNLSALYPAINTALTSSSDALMAANLFSRGTFVDVLFARSEVESLRAGPISPSWADSWRLMSSDSVSGSLITSFDASADFGASAAKRTRAQQMARYLTIAEPGGVQSNVLGLPYGTLASGLYALRDLGQVSLYGAQQRWLNLASTVDAFQSAAGIATQIANAAQHDALVQAVSGLNTSLKNEFTSIASASGTLSTIAKGNVADQTTALNEFTTAFASLQREENSLWTGYGSVVGCDPAAGDCVTATQNKLQGFINACQTNDGLDWLNTVVNVVGVFVPALKDANDASQAITGSTIAGNLGNILTQVSPGEAQADPQLSTWITQIKNTDTQFSQIEQRLQAAGAASTAMKNLMMQFIPCPAGGQAQTNLETFKTTVILMDNMVQDVVNAIHVTHADIQSILGQIAYLTGQGQTFDQLQNTQTALGNDLDANTTPLLTKLGTLTAGGSYFQIASQEKAFLTNACRTAITTARTGLADLYVISQALQTSTGRTSTTPYPVVPANAAYHFANGAAPTDMLKFDTLSDFAVSLWDDGAFSTRFTPSGTATTNPMMNQATTRYTQLINTEVCENGPVNSAAQFVVRKQISGQALRTLVKNGKVDFGLTIDDIVAAGNGHGDVTPPVRAAVSLDRQNLAYDLPLGGAFVVNVAYSACNGTTQGSECCPGCRVPIDSMGTVAGGALGSVSLTNRGQTYMPTAVPAPGCPAGQQSVTSNNVLTFATGPSYKLASCLTPLVTRRASSGLMYLGAEAGSTDAIVLNNNNIQCQVDARALASRPLQGLPVIGTWGLSTAVNAQSIKDLEGSSTPAPISPVAPPVPGGGVTAVEVLFLVGSEPVETNEASGYTMIAQ